MLKNQAINEKKTGVLDFSTTAIINGTQQQERKIIQGKNQQIDLTGARVVKGQGDDIFKPDQ